MTINKIKWTLTIFSLLTNFCLCLAQDKGIITIAGHIVDTDNTPLIRATVQDINTQKGTTTNKYGVFLLTLPQQTTTIRISYVGYHTFEKKITATDISQSKNDTLQLSISLKPKITELTEVEVRAADIQRAYDKPRILIIDYDFHTDGLLLLLSINNQYRLRLVDENSNTLNDITIRKKPERLYRDCLDDLHILYSDSTYQIKETNSELSLMSGFSIKTFSEYLLPCIAANDESLFFKEYGLHNQSMIYYLIEKESKQERLLQEIVDKKSLIGIDDYYRKTMAEAGITQNVMGENTVAQQNSARQVYANYWFYKSILNRPIYNPLCEVRDSLFLFNHLADTVFVYNKKGEFQRAFPINYHYKDGWKNELIMDYLKKEIYAKCVRDGLVYLLKIDPNSGHILSEFKLSGHVFPDKIKIRHGFAYYLSIDNKYNSVQNVYRQKLN